MSTQGHKDHLKLLSIILDIQKGFSRMSLFTWLLRRHKQILPPTSWKPTPPLPRIMDGRRHLTEQPYALPKDSQEEQRLMFQHRALYACLHQHYFAPLNERNVHKLLDVGCGPGAWLRDMAHLFPHARLVGLDSDSEQLPRAAACSPAFCHFIQGDVLHPLPFPDDEFDFTHMRCMVAAIPARAWPSVVAELVRVTRSGGWLELFDGGQACERVGPYMQQLLSWGKLISKQMGFDLPVIEQLGTMLRQADLHHVHEERFAVPLGKWGGRGGDLMARDMQAIFQTLKPLFCTTLPLAPEQFDATVQRLPAEWEHFHTSYVYLMAYGKK